ncbi:LysR family transcriptional regulator, partial [Mitsuokella jalaludinii]
MELTQLKYFQAMAKCRHFTQAAEEMAVSQSALSRSIQKLEQELGVTLFERHGRTSDLTEAGQKFLFHVDRVIRELALAEQEIELDNGGAGVVHLSFLHSLGDTFLPLILRQFHERYPHIDVKLNQQSSSMLAEQLTSGETDICLCSTMNEPDTAWMYLWSEEMFLVVPEDHPLAQKSRVSLREVGDEPFVALKPEYTLRQQVNQFLDLAESHPQIVFEGDEVHTLVSFVAAHLGVSVLPHV